MSKLSDFEINIKIKLSAIWSAVLSLYIYCDYFELYRPGKLESMIEGTAFFGKVSQEVVLGLSSILLVTSLMICLSVLLSPKINKVINILVGAIMTLMMAYICYFDGWYFYKMYAAVEAFLTLIVVWLAWNWPKEQSANNPSK
ncbi:hypothetical protein C1E23_20050 [Pseudoalteromonas phenolica]|uniref:DUF4345 domain-containing protein n=1 Tax=Pseudoalteromonas phenolica TaxID=161398 RepID=A0A4Q7IIC4_9GAMM|nr:DUF6326 family protein [Pseudoalteromonas phenolica]RZQ51361.1 hypothetical protein C1E23_20050 [Pseudoalteromonas phenolica]